LHGFEHACGIPAFFGGIRHGLNGNYAFLTGYELPTILLGVQRTAGPVRPAAMMISARLSDPRMRIEIEATALKSSQARVRD
jgi:hypothetical protein